jgi:tetratricopeptide (TPR) repeat protein/photosystem II stability/assembly factor-like uncharacterized protein
MAKVVGNPYIAGPPIAGDVGFYGREDIFRFVRDTFSSPAQNVIVLYGQRRIGKTSILYQLQKPSNLPSGFHPVYLDLQGLAEWHLDEVLYRLAQEIAKSLNIPTPSQSEFRIGDGDYFYDQFLPQVYEAMGEQQLLLLFDEFEVLSEKPRNDVAIQTFFPYLQKRMMSEQQVAFIFAVGRRLDELSDPLQATFKAARTKFVSFLREDDARQLITGLASGVVKYDEEAIEQIISLTACHPYLTQLVCYELVDYLIERDKGRATAEDVNAVIDNAIESGSAALAWLWDGLPRAERFFLSAVAHVTDEGGMATQYGIRDILQQYRVQLLGPELTRAPDALITKWGWLKPTKEGYKFVVELLRRWIIKEHSLEEAKRELELVSPRASLLYEAARRAHEENDLDTAIRHYKDALGANPYHSGAQLGLAQVLFEQGRVVEAITEYEKAYSLDETSARDGLVKARATLAQSLEKEGKIDQAIQEYDNILAIAPKDENAREWAASIWIRRGNRYFEEGNYQEALEAYDRAKEIQPNKKEAVEQSLQRIAMATEYTSAMRAHKAKDWIAAEEKWSKLYKKDRDYRDRDDKGEKVAILLAEVIEKREGVSKPQRTPSLVPSILALGSLMLSLYLGFYAIRTTGALWPPIVPPTPTPIVVAASPTIIVAVVTPTPEPTTPTPAHAEEPTPIPTPTPIPATTTPTNTPTPELIPTETITLTPTSTFTSTPKPIPTPIPTPAATPTPSLRSEVWDVDINPQNSKIIYVVSKDTGVYKTTDGGNSWRQILSQSNITSLTIDPSNPLTLYIATQDGVLKSTDSETTWEWIATVKGNLPEPAHVLAIASGDNQIIYAGTEGGVYRSSDGGWTWEERNKRMRATAIYSLVIGSNDGQLVYATGKGAEVWKSEDGGSSPWERLSCDYFREGIYTLALHPDDNRCIYAGTDRSLLMSTNGGRDWLLRDGGLKHPEIELKISALAIDRRNPDIIYAGTGFRSNYDGHGIYKSTNGGLSWEPINNGLPVDDMYLGGYYIQAIAIDPYDSQTIYAGGFSGLYKSTDGGASWNQK